jgi:hypothetical protein
MEVYTLDLETLLSLLQMQEQNGRLSSEVRGVIGLKEPCRVNIELQNGKIIACQIEGMHTKVRFIGEQALTKLSHLGTQEWKLEKSQQPQPSLVAPPSSAYPNERKHQSMLSQIPQRIRQDNLQLLNRLSRSQRRVWNLIDGVRSVEKIAMLLSSSPDLSAQQQQHVKEVMRELQTMGMITFKWP